MPTAGPFTASLVGGLRTVTDVPIMTVTPCAGYACAVSADILTPESGTGLPTVILLPGGPAVFTERRYLEALAADVARRDAVVFLGTYRSAATGHSEADSINDVRCAVRFARSATAEYGGDADRVVLVGHSVGSNLALRAALEAEAEPAGCLAGGSGVPDAVVAIAGFSTMPPTGATGTLLVLVSGSDDSEAAPFGQRTAAELRDAGFDAEYVELKGIDHFEVVDPAAAPQTLDIILDAAERLGS